MWNWTYNFVLHINNIIIITHIILICVTIVSLFYCMIRQPMRDHFFVILCGRLLWTYPYLIFWLNVCCERRFLCRVIICAQKLPKIFRILQILTLFRCDYKSNFCKKIMLSESIEKSNTTNQQMNASWFRSKQTKCYVLLSGLKLLAATLILLLLGVITKTLCALWCNFHLL